MKVRNKKLVNVALRLAIVGSSLTGVTAVAAESASAGEVQIASAKQSQYTQVKVTIDGKLQQFPQSAILYNSSTLVPMRGVFEALNATIKWDGDTQTVTATKD